jgi:hypothetical protein
MNVFFKDQFNSDIGVISIGSGGIQGSYETIYDSEIINEVQVKTDVDVDALAPRNFKFISSLDEDVQCSGIVNFKFLEAASLSNKLQYTSGLRVLKLQSPGGQFTNFSKVETGDILEVGKIKYLIKRKIDNVTIEANEDVILSPTGSTWKVWKDLRFGEDFIIPQTSTFNNVTILGGTHTTPTGREKIETTVGGINITDVTFVLEYVQKNGLFKTAEFGWTTNASDFKAYQPVETENVKLKEVHIFDKNDLVLDEDFFFTVDTSFRKFSQIYLTQEGFNKINSKYMRIELSQAGVNSNRKYILEKNSFVKGYQVPINYKNGVSGKADFYFFEL